MFVEKTEGEKEEILLFPRYKLAKHCRETPSLCGEFASLHENIEVDIRNEFIKNEYIQNKLDRLKKIDKMLFEYNEFINKNKLLNNIN
jgi:hypothetical protein